MNGNIKHLTNIVCYKSDFHSYSSGQKELGCSMYSLGQVISVLFHSVIYFLGGMVANKPNKLKQTNLTWGKSCCQGFFFS